MFYIYVIILNYITENYASKSVCLLAMWKYKVFEASIMF